MVGVFWFSDLTLPVHKQNLMRSPADRERDGDQDGAPLCLRPGLGWVSHKTKLNEKIEGFAELDK